MPDIDQFLNQNFIYLIAGVIVLFDAVISTCIGRLSVVVAAGPAAPQILDSFGARWPCYISVPFFSLESIWAQSSPSPSSIQPNGCDDCNLKSGAAFLHKFYRVREDGIAVSSILHQTRCAEGAVVAGE